MNKNGHRNQPSATKIYLATKILKAKELNLKIIICGRKNKKNKMILYNETSINKDIVNKKNSSVLLFITPEIYQMRY